MTKTVEEVLTTGKLLVWDLETTNFKANMGHLLTAACKWVGKDEVYTWRIDDVPGFGKDPKSFINDKPIVEELIEFVNEADALIHHFGDRFDLPFLNTRALAWNLLPPPKPTTIDTWKIMRSQLAMTSNRLGTGAAFLNGPEAQKGGLDISQWQIASHGDKKTLTAMLDYNVEDVIATEQMYLRLRPVIFNHPYIGPAASHAQRRTQCPACGSVRTHSHDTRRTKCYEVYRQRCMNCGTAFESGRVKIAP